mgnify:CR=1 FL=1
MRPSDQVGANRTGPAGVLRTQLGVTAEHVIDDDVRRESGDQHESVEHQEGCRAQFEERLHLERDEETDWEFIIDCTSVKEAYAIDFPYEEEDGDEINSCYGGESGKTDNFFCCTSRFLSLITAT